MCFPFSAAPQHPLLIPFRPFHYSPQRKISPLPNPAHKNYERKNRPAAERKKNEREPAAKGGEYNPPGSGGREEETEIALERTRMDVEALPGAKMSKNRVRGRSSLKRVLDALNEFRGNMSFVRDQRMVGNRARVLWS